MAFLLLKTVFLVLVRVELLLMIVRAILSWITPGSGFVYGLIVTMTEPVIFPVRLIFDKLMPKAALPIDIPFLASYLLLNMLELLLRYL